MNAQLFKGGFEIGTESQHRQALVFGDGTKIMKRETIILTWVEIVTQNVVKRTKI